jgi:hypothetical protein
MRVPKLRLSLSIFLILIAILAFTIQGTRILSRAIIAGLGSSQEREEQAAFEEAVRLSREGFITQSNAALARARYHGRRKDHYSKLLRSIP